MYWQVLHGDCVLDTELGCTVLGGDSIMEVLAAELKPKRVVFLTNVEGIFTKPPDQIGARLINVSNHNEK
jgi:isopentenyl phosphate kinase